MKDTYIKFRCSSKDKQYIQDKADGLGVSITSYILSKCVEVDKGIVIPPAKNRIVYGDSGLSSIEKARRLLQMKFK